MIARQQARHQRSDTTFESSWTSQKDPPTSPIRPSFLVPEHAVLAAVHYRGIPTLFFIWSPIYSCLLFTILASPPTQAAHVTVPLFPLPGIGWKPFYWENHDRLIGIPRCKPLPSPLRDNHERHRLLIAADGTLLHGYVSLAQCRRNVWLWSTKKYLNVTQTTKI